MNIFELLKNLYTNEKSDWIVNLSDEDILAGNLQPFLIQRWLIMNDRVRNEVRYLDKYVFSLTPKQYISLAWTIIPKTKHTPFVKYIKKVDNEEEFKFILDKVRRHFKLSDNDFNSVKDRLVSEIKKDMINWFSFYGVEKWHWKEYYLDFNKIKEFDVKEKIKIKGLFDYGK